MREAQGQDDDVGLLFADEKEAAMQQKKEEERERAVNVPGLLKPSEINADEEL